MMEMNDSISRKWLMECVDEGWIKFDTEKDTNTYIHLVRDIAPSKDVEPVRHGHFIGTKFYEWKCSECGCIFEDEEPTFNYCPNCGAKMDGEQNG